MLKAKEAESSTPSQAPAPSQSVNTPVVQCSTSPIPLEHTKYYVICTPLGNICPNEYPMCSDWNKDLKEEDRKNQEIENQMTVKGRHLKQAPNSHWLLPLLLGHPNPPLNSYARGPV